MKGTRRAGLSARLRAVIGSILVVGVMQVAAPVTFAAATPPSSCSWGDKWYGIDTLSKPYAITHRVLISVAPGTEYNQSTTLGVVNSITASVSGTLSGTVEENLIIEKASVTASLTLEESGTKTVTSNVSFSWKITNNSSVQKRYVIFTAPHRVTGTYTKWQCTRFETWSKVTSGTYLSFDYEMRGSALCGYTYSSGSAEKMAQDYCP
jgi:hypothetical protein